eukprot:2381658-Prorocentrum_lima.AAC.1
MTSSLVGSEMCIRDRFMFPQRPGNSRGNIHEFLGTELERDAVGSTLSSVSYTHLTLPTICSV